MSPQLAATDFISRFHGHDERIDLESLRLSTRLWLNLIHQFTGGNHDA
jgi:acetylornithine deacetylase/succinyl-diaminopimelate desuccinylase-like protein